MSTRDLPIYRDPAVILIDQLKQVYFDGELETIDSTAYFPKILRKDFTVGLNLQSSGPDPDPTLDLFYGCGASLNFDGYCNPEVDKLIEQQSIEADQERRKAAGVGDRTQAGRGRSPTDHLLHPRCDLLAALREGADNHGRQPFQRQPHERTSGSTNKFTAGTQQAKEERKVAPVFRAVLAMAVILAATAEAEPASAQKSGGVLRMPMITSPASMSIHEESTIAALGPMMGVFNNLVMFDQHVPQNSLKSIVPDLASSWSWSEDGKELTFKLRQGVKWHDGKPFTAKDVKCTWDLITGTAAEKFRVNPRKSWYRNLEEVTVEGR